MWRGEPIVGGLWPLAERVETPQYYYLGLAALVAAMIWGGIVAYRSWEEATEDLDPASRDEILEALRQAKLEGELDEQEFERVRRLVDEKTPGDRRPWTFDDDHGDDGEDGDRK